MGILIAGVMIMSPLFYSPAYAQSDEEQLNIEDPELYYVKKYHSGDCVLCSNAYMIMRAAYYNGSEDYQKITNNLLRRYACTSKYGCIMKHDYKFTFDGVTYRIKAKSLSGKKSAKEKKLRDLLEEHPEGIVVRGAARSGGHGILLTSYEDGKFYAVDSAQNYHGRNKGIVEYDDTTMYSIKRLTQIWYIESQTGFPKSHIDDIALFKTTVKDHPDLLSESQIRRHIQEVQHHSQEIHHHQRSEKRQDLLFQDPGLHHGLRRKRI